MGTNCYYWIDRIAYFNSQKLRAYLDSLKGAFNEVIAFKPSGWENGKNSAVEKDMVTIHGESKKNNYLYI